MKQNRKHFINWYTAAALVLVVAAAATAGIMLRNNNKTDAAASVKPGIGAAVPSQFKFSGAMGWWQGATNKTSMAIFHTGDSCFTSVEHKSGTVDAGAELQKQKDLMTSDGYTVNTVGTQALSLQTSSGAKQYNLQQLDVIVPAGGNALLAGQEFGYVQLPDGYVKVQAYCDTAAQLSATIPVLQAITFNKNN